MKSCFIHIHVHVFLETDKKNLLIINHYMNVDLYQSLHSYSVNFAYTV